MTNLVFRLFLVCLMLAGCGDDVEAWAYEWGFNDTAQALHGMLTLTRDGDRLSGDVEAPWDLPAGERPEYWDWRLGGTATAIEISAGPGCRCKAPPPWLLDCSLTFAESAPGRLLCSAQLHDDFGDHYGTFSAARQ